MIDEKKIEKAAIDHLKVEQAAYRDESGDVSYPTSIKDIEGQIMDIFMDCAHWAINSLWHDVSEEPMLYDTYLVKTLQGCVDMCFFDAEGWHEPKIGGGNVVMWLDLKDLLPKEGGER